MSISSFPLLGNHIRFLKGAVSGSISIEPSPNPSGMKTRYTISEQQLSGLVCFYGAPFAQMLRSLEGGHLSDEISILSSWAEGNKVPLGDFSHTLDTFEKALSDPESRFAQEILKAPVSSNSFSFTLSQAVLSWLESCKIDHEFNPFLVNEVGIDPLLDVSPMPEILAYFEKRAPTRTSIEIPSLDLAVCIPQNLSLHALSDFYRLLEDTGYAFYLVDNILYVIPEDDSLSSMRPDIEKLEKAGLVSKFRQPTVSPEKSSHFPSRIDIQIPWNDQGLLGTLDLYKVIEGCGKRWILGEAPDFKFFSNLPALHVWLQREQDILHWSDVKKLKEEISIIKAYVYQEKMTKGQRESSIRRIQGILGEIHHRKEVLKVFETGKNQEAILLVEGEVRTADGRMTSDALIGTLDPSKRLLTLETLFEIGASSSQTNSSVDQHQQNLHNRFPEKGLAIFDADGKWGRVDVDSEGAKKEVVLSSKETHEQLRDASEVILREILSFISLKRYREGIIPAEEKRRYRVVGQNIQRAGNLLAWVADSLWKELDRLKELSGTYDLLWLNDNLATRSSFFPEIGRSFLNAYRFSLCNVSDSPDLNPKGVRNEARAIEKQTGVGDETIGKYQDEISKELKKRGLGVLSDPWQEEIDSRANASSAKEKIDLAWVGIKTVKEMNQVLEALISQEINQGVKKFIEAYRLSLCNVSASPDLNPEGVRKSALAIAALTGVNKSTIGNYQNEIQNKSIALGFKTIPDPESRAAAKSAREKIGPIWDRIKTVEDLKREEELLRTLITQETDDDVKKYIKAFHLSLCNVSRDLNSSGKRKSALAIDALTGVEHKSIRRYQEEIQKKLEELGLDFFPNPGKDLGNAISSANSAREKIGPIWNRIKTVEDLKREEEALRTLIAQETGDVINKYIEAFHLSLCNVSRDLSSSGERKSAPTIEAQTGVNSKTINSYLEEIQNKLEEMGLDFFPNPGKDIGDAISFARSARKKIGPIWDRIKTVEDLKREEEALRTLTSQETDENVKRYISAFRLSLCNVARDLNSSGDKKTARAIEAQTGVNRRTISSYQEEIQNKLEEMGLDFIPVRRKK